MKQQRTMKLMGCVLGCALAMTAGAAGTHYVAQAGQTPSGTYTSWETAASNIQDAVGAALSGDTVLVSNGLYNAGGTVNARVDFSGKAISVLAVSTNPYDTIVDGGGTSRCFNVDKLGTPSLIAGFLITNAWVNAHGGGMYVGASDNKLVVTNCIFEGNVVQAAGMYGGAVMAYYPNVVTLKNCVLRGNASRLSYGGGAYQCVLTNDCQVLNNSATNALAGGLLMCTMYGGLLAGNQALGRAGGDRCTLYNVIVSNNMATGDSTHSGYGGGLSGGKAYGCSFFNNRAPSGYGGGISDIGTLASNCLFSGNYAYCGGAASDGTILLNCVISNNSVAGNGYGAGMYNGGVASNCLFTANTGYFGGAASKGVTLVDCVISNNSTLYIPGIHADGTAGSACKAIRCVFIGNTATYGYGGAAMNSYLNDCLIVKNHVKSSNIWYCWLVNCTVVNNDTAGTEAAVLGGSLTNCIVWGNRKSGGVINNYGNSPAIAYSCTTPLPTGGSDGGGNTDEDPRFADAAGGNYRLTGRSSYCVNKGTTLGWMAGTIDLDRRPRVRSGSVDMGAYEFVPAGTVCLVR